MATARENILKKIKQALVTKVPVPFSTHTETAALFQPSQKELEIEFAEHFTSLQGRFSFCANHQELTEQLNQLFISRKWEKIYCIDEQIQGMLATSGMPLNPYHDLASCDASITGCELLVARTGSIFLSNTSSSGRTTSVYAPVHICIAKTSQLVYSLEDALLNLTNKYGSQLPSVLSLATGPSRTADIEKTLVVGVHGPKEVYCFLIDE
ncbi:LutC/YkgG family protein [Sediminibacterium sp.]|uniref:LutC/YkgG family protein n=1 Tax=Sediminibacterium sp. TaxID=1917865 RepID=UPI003F6978A5